MNCLASFASQFPICQAAIYGMLTAEAPQARLPAPSRLAALAIEYARLVRRDWKAQV